MHRDAADDHVIQSLHVERRWALLLYSRSSRATIPHSQLTIFCTFGGSDREEQHERPQTQIPLAEKAAAGNPFPFGGQLETEEKTNGDGGGDDARARHVCKGAILPVRWARALSSSRAAMQM